MFLIELLAVVMMAIPTIAFYGWIAGFLGWAAVCLRRKQKVYAALLLVIGLAPGLAYAGQYVNAYARHQCLVSVVVDAQNLPRLSNPPRTLIVHGHSGDTKWLERLLEMGAFDEVFAAHADQWSRWTNERRPDCGRAVLTLGGDTSNVFRARSGYLVCPMQTRDSRIPDDGLHLYIGSVPRSPPGLLEGQPRSLELRMIDGNEQRIVGLWAIPAVDSPVFPPMLFPGFMTDSIPQHTSVPNYGELAFVIGGLRFSLKT